VNLVCVLGEGLQPLFFAVYFKIIELTDGRHEVDAGNELNIKGSMFEVAVLVICDYLGLRSKKMFIAKNKLRLLGTHETGMFLVDLIMLYLISINLLWLLFDTLFSSSTIQSVLMVLAPDLTHYYAEEVHPAYIEYDLIFVSIYVTELIFSWGVAIKQKTYERWFFYPIAHWYDVLGCFPLSDFRWLRLLRLFSIISRLQKHNIIDLSQTYLYRFVRRYYNKLLEDLSSHVVIFVIGGIQREIRRGNPFAERVVKEALLPQKDLIVSWLTDFINELTHELYFPNKLQLLEYIRSSLHNSFIQNSKAQALANIPVIGEHVYKMLSDSAADIAFGFSDQVITDLGHVGNDKLIREFAEQFIDRLLSPSNHLDEASRRIMMDVLGLLKDEIHKRDADDF